MTPQGAVGFFGKLPCNGDFLQRRVPQSFLDVWDPWLQECIHTSRQALQEQWLPTYLTSPLWRFVLPDSVCGSGAYAGILAPSVDRVGRYFPLTIVAQIDIATNPLVFATRQFSWFESLETLVIKALDEPSVDLEWFDEQVAAYGDQHAQQEYEAAGDFTDLFERSEFPQQHTAWRVPLGTSHALQDAINALAYRVLTAQLRPSSVWWTEGSEAISACWLNVRGLPAAERFTAMLDGRWGELGWGDAGGMSGSAAFSTPPAEPVPPARPELHEALPMAAPRVTVPDVQLSAIETNRAAFVLRPEIGLWATIATDRDADPTAVRLISDALQQVAAGASLTGLVEGIRAQLAEVHRGLLHVATRDVLRIESHASVVVLLLSGDECAFVSAGETQSLRVRARKMEWLDETERTDQLPEVSSGSLMELISGAPNSLQSLGSGSFQDVRVHYERLLREDQLILCARPVIGAHEAAQLAATAASGLPISAAGIVQMLSPPTQSDLVVPVMTLEA